MWIGTEYKMSSLPEVCWDEIAGNIFGLVPEAIKARNTNHKRKQKSEQGWLHSKSFMFKGPCCVYKNKYQIHLKQQSKKK